MTAWILGLALAGLAIWVFGALLLPVLQIAAYVIGFALIVVGYAAWFVVFNIVWAVWWLRDRDAANAALKAHRERVKLQKIARWYWGRPRARHHHYRPYGYRRRRHYNHFD